MRVRLSSQGIASVAFLFLLGAVLSSGRGRIVFLLIAVAIFVFSAAVHRGRRVTMSLAVPVAIISFVVVLVIVFQVSTGLSLWSSWLFILVMIGVTVAGYRRSKRLKAQSHLKQTGHNSVSV